MVEATPTLEMVAKMALGWESRCSESHQACTKDNSTSYLPKRVIDVGIDDDSVPRLYEPVESISARYVALSYCWGPEGHNLTTTHESLPSHRLGIPLASLPRTFLQATQLCRLLGVRYIWIDSLCIIQQDQADWEYHAARMDSIYGNAWIVFSASASSNVHQGLLVDRGKALAGFNAYKLPVDADHLNDINPAEKGTCNIFVRRRLPHSTIIPEVVYPNNNCPLLTRGWTFQERLLAKRTLHFLPEELMWECESDYCCECMSCHADLSEEGSALDGKGLDPAMLRSSEFNRVMVTNPSHEAFDRLWRTIVSSYSHRQFTRYEDRLPALWGVATVIETKSAHMGGYYAGHWGVNLAMNLMWQIEEEVRTHGNTPRHDNSTIHENTRAIPSWAWASTPFPVKWEIHELGTAQMEAIILETGWTSMPVYSTHSPDTPVKGRVTLEGKLTVATIDTAHFSVWKVANIDLMEARTSADPDIVRGRREAKFYPDVPPGHSTSGSWCPHNLNKLKIVHHNQLVNIVLMFSYKKRGEGYLARQYSHDLDAEVTYWYGLALVESEQLPGAYERVGLIKGRFIGYYSSGWFGGIEKSRIVIV